MHNINNTTIANAVNAIFALGYAEELKGIASAQYAFGTYAEQDYRAVMSALYSVRTSIVSLQFVSPDTPVADTPKDGSLESNDAGLPDEREAERRDLLKKALLTHALLERSLESLAEKARKDTEKAGNRTHDGGRFRFNLSYGSREFKAYGDSWEDYLNDMAARSTPGSQWLKKIDAAREMSFPLVDAQQALNALPHLFGEDEMVALSHKAWAKLVDSFALYGEAMKRHEQEQAAFNAGDQDDHAKAIFSNQCTNFRRETRDAQYWASRFMEPVALLAVIGAPAYLTDSPYWRTHEAKRKALKAESEAAEAEAMAAEAMAKALQVKASMRLMDALELQDQAEADLAAMRAAMNARREARNTQAVKVQQEPVSVVGTQAEGLADVSVAVCGPRITNTKGGQPLVKRTH